MKLIYTFAFLLPFLAASQSFTSANEPAIGSLQSLFLCDSNTNSYESTVGNGVTWDYSQLAGIFGVVKDVQIQDATLDPNFAAFNGSQKVMSIGTTLSTFFSSTPNDRTSQGFVFNEVSLGSVVASWSVDPENLMAYPFALGNNINDVFSGTITSAATGVLSAQGISTSSADGSGTLLLPNGGTYTNVLRYHLRDSASAVIFGTPVSFVRNEYEYYDLATSNLPIFIYTRIKVVSALLNNTSTLVLSKDQPTTFVGVNELANQAFSISPNPVMDQLNIEGLAGAEENYSVIDLTGREYSIGKTTGKIDLSALPSGTYFLKIGNTVKKFIK